MNPKTLLIPLLPCSLAAASCQHNPREAQKPNIIVILSDDMGFSDLSCYGSEISTPNLDALAEQGVRFNQFYNCARSCPTRASLLTGLYPHQAGVGYMTEKLGNTSAYQGFLRDDRKTIAEMLQTQGYTTLHVGKWHVGTPANGVMPCSRGFERGWSPVGRVNYWNTDRVYEDGEVRGLNENEKGYLTDVTGDKAIEYIEYATGKDNPFFLYLALNAAHWPLHAKPEDIEKYRGKFMKGWDRLREERIHRIDSIGLVPAMEAGLIRDKEVPAWTDYPEADTYAGYHSMISGKHDQDDWDLKMSIYAAQIESMDKQIGRIIETLKKKGIFENTIILYMQDNGGCAEGIGKEEEVAPGGADSYNAYSLPWAYLSNTPFRNFKHFLHEGGISTPLIASWPKGILDERKGAIEKESFGHIVDILPTCLAAAGGNTENLSYAVEGENLLEVINGKEENSDRTIYWEHEGNRAVRKGEWKLVSRYPDDILFFEKWEFPRAPRTQEWELYNIKTDRWELKECSSANPETTESLKQLYLDWEVKAGALPRREIISGSAIKF
ncbi:MAG TPA: arylsulfatase [Bacteroidales bacterium]|nr:arylsulfatase [Bacteroidales bacterium]